MGNLMKCPFCGGEAATKNRHNRYTDWWEVKCTDCNALLNERYEYEFEAVAAWNTRKPMEEVVAELEKLPRYRWGVTMLTAEEYVKVADLRKAISIVRGKE